METIVFNIKYRPDPFFYWGRHGHRVVEFRNDLLINAVTREFNIQLTTEKLSADKTDGYVYWSFRATIRRHDATVTHSSPGLQDRKK